MEFQTVRYEQMGPVARITLNRPEVMNALSRQMRRELMEAIDTAEGGEAVRVVILTGAGRAFSAGIDLKESATIRRDTPKAWREAITPTLNSVLKIWNSGKPVIGAINGHALGAGCDLALATDVTIASSEARFGEPEIAHFSGPPALLMPWVVGIKKAKELLLTGKAIDAYEAERIGLVNKVVPPQELEAEALRMAHELASIPALSLEYNKRAINQTYEIQGLMQALQYNVEVTIQNHLSESPEDKAARVRFVKERGLRALDEVGYDKAVEEGRVLLQQQQAATDRNPERQR